MDDADLLRQLLGGDEKAFTELVVRYNATLIRIALYYVNNQASAEDGADRHSRRGSFTSS
ncbi:MAG: hypothetical protein ABSE75_06620 [Acidimicrobiales bacterium]